MIPGHLTGKVDWADASIEPFGIALGKCTRMQRPTWMVILWECRFKLKTVVREGPYSPRLEAQPRTKTHMAIEEVRTLWHFNFDSGLAGKMVAQKPTQRYHPAGRVFSKVGSKICEEALGKSIINSIKAGSWNEWIKAFPNTHTSYSNSNHD